MSDEHLNNPKSPKFHVKKYLDSLQQEWKNKIVLDVPAGNGATSELFLGYGAKVQADDLFPEPRFNCLLLFNLMLESLIDRQQIRTVSFCCHAHFTHPAY